MLNAACKVMGLVTHMCDVKGLVMGLVISNGEHAER